MQFKKLISHYPIASIEIECQPNCSFHKIALTLFVPDFDFRQSATCPVVALLVKTGLCLFATNFLTGKFSLVSCTHAIVWAHLSGSLGVSSLPGPLGFISRYLPAYPREHFGHPKLSLQLMTF